MVSRSGQFPLVFISNLAAFPDSLWVESEEVDSGDLEPGLSSGSLLLSRSQSSLSETTSMSMSSASMSALSSSSSSDLMLVSVSFSAGGRGSF